MKKFIAVMLAVNVLLLYMGYKTLIEPYKSIVSLQRITIEALNDVMDDERIEYESRITILLSDKDALTALLVETQENLSIFYAFKQAGIKADSVETVRDMILQMERLPFGSPFRDGHIITDKFGIRDERWFNGNGTHDGIDIVSRGSWEILTTADGYISDFGYNDTYGRWIEYITDGGYKIIYGHLSKIYWQEGTKVKDIHLSKGTRIARMGNTGLTSGPHLHFELQVKNNEGEYVKFDPEEIISYIGG